MFKTVVLDGDDGAMMVPLVSSGTSSFLQKKADTSRYSIGNAWNNAFIIIININY